MRLCAAYFLRGRALGRVCGCALGRALYLACLYFSLHVILGLIVSMGLHITVERKEGLADLAYTMLEWGSAPAVAQRAGLHTCCGRLSG